MSRRSETTTKVFVGSLPAQVTTDDLRKLFEPYGAIAECDIANRCGFLHLEDVDLAMKAIEDLNGTDFMGAKISVEKGRVKPRGGFGGRGGRGGGGGPMRGGRQGDRGGPYSRGDFRGPPRNNGYGGGRDYGPYGGMDAGDRYGNMGGGYDRPPFRDYGSQGGYGARPPVYGGPERRQYSGGYGDRNGGRPYGDDRGAYDDRRGGYDDRRPPMMERQVTPIPRVPMDSPGYERAPDLYSRRDISTAKPIVTGGYNNGADPYGPPYGTPGYGSNQSVGYGADRPGYNTGPNYGDNYGAGQEGAAGPGPRSYESAYPPLPQQRGG